MKFLTFCVMSLTMAWGSTLKVGTFNIGMLPILNLTPFAAERTAALHGYVGAYLADSQIDILSIQEAWTKESQSALDAVSSEYAFLSAPKRGSTLLDYKTGLGFLVKASLARDVETEFVDFQEGESYVCGFGLVCDRGVFILKFVKDGKRFAVVNTHLTPFLNLIAKRAKQAFEIVEHIASLEADFVILAGDLNYSPHVEALANQTGSLEKWGVNAQLYQAFFNKLGDRGLDCGDTYLEAGSQAPYFSCDPENNLLAQKTTMSGEPRQRCDHIFYCDLTGGLEVLGTDLSFVDATVEVSNATVHLSDHFGVEATFAF